MKFEVTINFDKKHGLNWCLKKVKDGVGSISGYSLNADECLQTIKKLMETALRKEVK